MFSLFNIFQILDEITIKILSSGNLEVNLGKLPRPKKAAKKCDLAMLDDEIEIVDLFEAKTQKGWWIMAEEMPDGTREERVS